MNVKMTIAGAGVLGTAVATALLLGCDRRTGGEEVRSAGAERSARIDTALVIKDALRRRDESVIVSPLYGGCRVETTLNGELQRKAGEILCRHADTNDTSVGMAVVLRVEDGAVLAMTDCGEVSNAVPLAVGRSWELGSVLAPLTAAIAIDKDIVRMDAPISTRRDDDRYYKLPGDFGHEWPETMTMRDALIRSSNIVMGKIGYDLGEAQLHDGFSAFGIGQPTHLGYFVEDPGFLAGRGRWARAMRSRVPIGQGVTVSLMQLARAYAVLAHGGEYVEPYVVSCVKNASGRDVYRHTRGEPRRIVSKETADQVLEAMAGAVSEEGTARRARVKDVSVAGKTGTAQRLDSSAHQYSSDRFRATFCGCFPASSPKYVVAVMFETKRVKGSFAHQAGYRPAMAFSEIVAYMNPR